MNERRLLEQMELGLKEEYSIYLKILELSNEQIEELDRANPDADRIADLMDRKMILFGEIRELETRHAPIKQQWEKGYTAYTEEERAPIAELRDTMMATIERLDGIEERIGIGIKKCEAEVNRQLASIRRGRNANNAYFNIDQGPPRFIDRIR